MGTAASAPGADVYGNKTPWTNNDSIIFDLQRKRALAEAADRVRASASAAERQAEDRRRAQAQWEAEAGDREQERAARSKKNPEPAASKVSYEAWSEEQARKRANAGDLDGMYLYGRRLLETGRSHGQGWLEDAAKRGDLDSAKYLLDRSNGLSGGKKDLVQKRRWLTLLMNRPNYYNGRWHYGELLAATYDGSEGPRDAAGLAQVLEGLLKGGDENNARFYSVAATQLSELYSSGEGVPRNLDRALALSRDALAHTREPTPAHLYQLASVLAMSEGSYREHHAEIVMLWTRAAEGKGPGQAKAVDRLIELFAGENPNLESHLKMDALRRASPVQRGEPRAREILFEAGRGGSRRAWEELVLALDEYGFPKKNELTYESRVMLDGAGKAGYPRAWGILGMKASRSSDLTTRSVGRDFALKGIAQNDPTSFAARAMLEEGDFKPDWKKIAADYRRAADGGLLLGMIRTGQILRSEHLGKPDLAGAYEWMNRAADGGSSFARLEVARMLVEGEGVAPDVEKGIAILEEGTQHELPVAFRMLGHYLIEGKKIPANAERGYPKILYAARCDDLEAMNLVGLANLRGKGCPPNRTEAREWLKRASEKEHLPALRNLAELLWTEPRPAEQQALFVKSVEAFDRSPNDLLAVDHELMLGALNTLTRVAQLEPARVQLQIGLMLLNRENGFAPPFGFNSPDAATLSFEPAALAGDALAQYYFGLCRIDYASRSKGTDYDVSYSREGLALLRKAAAGGQRDAARILAAAQLTSPSAPEDRAAWDRLQQAAVAELRGSGPKRG